MESIMMFIVFVLLGFFAVCSAFMEKGEYISEGM